MSLQDDLLCILTPYRHMMGQDACIDAMRYSRAAVTAPAVESAFDELIDKRFVRAYTEEGKRAGIRAQERLLCTMPMYRLYTLTRLGIQRRSELMSRRRSAEIRQRKRA